MGRICTVCHHHDRARIEFALARSTPMPVIARRFGLSRDAVRRHSLSHVPPAVLVALRAKALKPEADLEKLRIEESTGLLEHLVAQRGRLHQVRDACAEQADWRAVLVAERDITSNLEVTGKLLGEFVNQAAVVTQSLITSQEYLKLRALLLSALVEHPEARKAVVAALREVETASNVIPITPRRIESNNHDESDTTE